MNCPFCSTHIDQHKTGKCANAWLAQLMGMKKPHYKYWTTEDGITYKYKEEVSNYPESRSVDIFTHTWPPPLTTDYSVFFEEVVPKLPKYWDMHSKDDGEYILSICGKLAVFYTGVGDSILEAGFRSSVKYLSMEILWHRSIK